MASRPAPSKTTTRSNYHHGDLRRALIQAAIDILNDTQRWDFSLREVARRAGVSHNAPYAHFADKRTLLAAVASVGYGMLRDRMLTASEQSDSASEALYETGHAYIRFGIENPAFYRLIFGADLRSQGVVPDDIRAATDSAREVLSSVLRRGADDGSFDLDADDPASVSEAFLARWALVHGFTMLAIDDLARLETPIDIDRVAHSLTDRFLRGLAA